MMLVGKWMMEGGGWRAAGFGGPGSGSGAVGTVGTREVKLELLQARGWRCWNSTSERNRHSRKGFALAS